VPPLPKFVTHWSELGTNFGSEWGTSKFMILVPLFDLKFLNVPAASGVGTANRRHWGFSPVKPTKHKGASGARDVPRA